MKPIKLRSTVIEIPFEDEAGNIVYKLSFDKADKALDDLLDSAKKIQESLAEQDENMSRQESREYIKRCFDGIFGDGKFDELYALTPSTDDIAEYFMIAVVQISQSFNADRQRALLDRYLSTGDKSNVVNLPKN